MFGQTRLRLLKAICFSEAVESSVAILEWILQTSAVQSAIASGKSSIRQGRKWIRNSVDILAKVC
jgi:hypothetical protein